MMRASSACLRWELRRARRRAESSSSTTGSTSGPRARLGVGLRRRAADHSLRRASGCLGFATSRIRLPEAANSWSSGFLEQRLTPEGVELLRSEIVSTGLFEHHQPAGDSSATNPQRDPGANRRQVGWRQCELS